MFQSFLLFCRVCLFCADLISVGFKLQSAEKHFFDLQLSILLFFFNRKKRQLYISVWFNKEGILLFLKFCPLKAKTKVKGTYLSLYLGYCSRVSWIHSVILWRENWNKEERERKKKNLCGVSLFQLRLKEKHFVEERLAALLILFFLRIRI